MSERRYQFTDTRNIQYTYFLERDIIPVTKYTGNPCIKPGTSHRPTGGVATEAYAKPAELLEIYPTLTELLKLPKKKEIDHQTNFLPLFCSSGRRCTPRFCPRF